MPDGEDRARWKCRTLSVIQSKGQNMSPSGLPEYAALLFRWEVSIISIGCIILLVTTAMLGMRITGGKRTRRAAFWMTIVMPLFQFPASAMRFFISSTPSFKLARPIDSYIDLFWSPICTLFIIWLYRKHLINSCRLCEIDVPRERAHDAIHVVKIFLAVATGFLASFFLSTVCFNDGSQHMVPLFCTMVTLASAGAMAEIVIHRIVWGRVALINYSWFWYIGAWTYFVTRV